MRPSSVIPCLLLLEVLAVPAGAQGQPPALRRTRIEVVYSSSLFRTVSKNDAVAAMRAWMDTVGRREGFLLDCRVTIAEDLAELKKRLLAGPTTLVLVDPLEYFELSEAGFLEPSFFGARGQNGDETQYLLVARQDSGVAALGDLRGKTLTLETDSRADLSRKWIEVLLQENRLGPAERFFASLSPASSPSAAVLPVFFGKAGAGVVDRVRFEVMKEMNPQLASRLRVLAASPPLIHGILCVDKRHVEYREDLMRALRDLHLDPAGRQILLVFRANRLAPVTPQALERVRGLWTKYLRIPEAKAASRSETPDAARHAGARP